MNDFNLLGRTYRVTAQADWPHRISPEDVADLKVRNTDGVMVPFGAFIDSRETVGPYRVPRFNLYNAAEIQGNTAPGVSSGEALDRMEAIADNVLPYGISYEWTELSYLNGQQATPPPTSLGLRLFSSSLFWPRSMRVGDCRSPSS